jgi:hypothetical protein
MVGFSCVCVCLGVVSGEVGLAWENFALRGKGLSDAARSASMQMDTHRRNLIAYARTEIMNIRTVSKKCATTTYISTVSLALHL